MRQLIIPLMLILWVVSYAQGQDGDRAPCAISELSLAQGWKAEYDQLNVETNLTDGSTDDVLGYSAKIIEWRDRLWSQLPLCDEAIDIAVLMSEQIGDIAATALFTYARELLSPIPFDDKLFFRENKSDHLREQFERINQLIVSGERPDDAAPADRRLRSCSTADIERIIILQAEQEVLAQSAFNTTTIGDLLARGKALLEWRDGLWDSMPVCHEGFEIGWLLSRTAGDMISDMSLRFAGVSLSQNPYTSQLTDDFNRIKALLRPLEAAAASDSQISPTVGQTNQLPRCSESQLASLADDLSEFVELTQLSQEISTTSDYLEYGARYIDWREDLWEALPICGQALEIGRAAHQAAGDISSVHGLYLGGARLEDNEVWTGALDMLSLLVRLSAALSDLAAGEALPPLDASSDYSSPSCTDYESEFVFDMLDELNAVAELATKFNSADDLLEFSIVQIQWREHMWTSMPVCKESTELAWQMFQITADTVSAAALEMFAGLAKDENPFWQQILIGRQRLAELAAELQDN
ncbi:MAG: hypothetical protein OXE52_19010 [Chloroflexi bacterium]|nr:hypothetical protein [Chloroflexota bacterium]